MENIESEELNNDLKIKYENKKVKLLYTSFSILGLICYIGPFVIMPILKNTNTTLHKLVELYEIFPTLFKTAPKKPSKNDDIIANFLAWVFVIFVSAIGCLGVLLTPFYSFMN